MRETAKSMLAGFLETGNGRVLDAGCGTGGFLRWLGDETGSERLWGIDSSTAGIALARVRVPEARLCVASLCDLPFGDALFKLILINDVLQHIPAGKAIVALKEARRVIRPGGALFIRTNAARVGRRERDDWRIYSPQDLVSEVESSGFKCLRVTYANLAGALADRVRGRRISAPDGMGHGIPAPAGRAANALGRILLGAEARFLAKPGRRIPYGASLFALAVPNGADNSK